MKPFIYSLLCALAAGVVPVAIFGFDNLIQGRKPVTNLGVLILVMVVISVFMVAFFYFRATFPH